MNPDAQSPGPHEVTSGLIDAVHRAIMHHPAVDAKADFGKILATLLQRQAKQHAAQTTATQHAVTPPAGGYAGGQGLAPPDSVNPTGGYIDQNISPILAALIAHGGTPSAAGFHPFQQAPESGLLGAVMAAQHVPVPRWAG